MTQSAASRQSIISSASGLLNLNISAATGVVIKTMPAQMPQACPQARRAMR